MNHQKKSFYFLCLAIFVCLLGVAKLSFADLVLWNKLDSEEEVIKSKIGPGGFIVGDVDFDSAQFENGVRSDGSGTEYVGFPSSVVNAERGCIEFWYKPMYDVVDGFAQDGFNHVMFESFDTTYGGGGVMIKINQPPNEPDRGLRGIYVSSFNSGVEIIQNKNINWLAGDLVHIALIWDVEGIQQGTDTMRLYLNGEIIASTDAAITPFSSQMETLIIGNNWTGSSEPSNGYIDNLKIWDYAKTDFTDRFYEAPENKYIAVITIPDINGNGYSEVAVLRLPMDYFDSEPLRPVVHIKDSYSKKTIRKISYALDFNPVDLTVISDLSGNGVPEIGVLGRNNETRRVKVQFRDAITGEQVNNIGFLK